MTKLRLLLVSGASVVGQSVLAALAHRREEIDVVATGSDASELALFDFDATYVTPETASGPEAFAARLAEIVARERPALAIPCRDDDVVALAELRERTPGLPALCGSAAAARVMADKWASAEFSLRHGLPYAPSLVAGSAQSAAEFVRAHGYPLVAKPRVGYASRGVRLVYNDEQLRRALARDGGMVQKFLGDRAGVQRLREEIDALGVPLFHSVEGPMRSLQALIAPDGTVAQVVCTRTVMRQGRSQRLQLDPDPAAHALGLRCARAFSGCGWRGPLNVQCQATPEGELFIHEFNGRYTGATGARRLLGQDEVGPAIALFTGHRFGSQGRVAPPVEVVRVTATVAADPERLRALQAQGAWRRGAAEVPRCAPHGGGCG